MWSIDEIQRKGRKRLKATKKADLITECRAFGIEVYPSDKKAKLVELLTIRHGYHAQR